MIHSIPKPHQRSPIRKWLGRQYYCLRRYWQWRTGRQQFAQERGEPLSIEIFQHRSPLLRQLKAVDMYLQHNKITNLRIAAAKLDGIIIRPGETFSFWYLVGRTTRQGGYQTGMMLNNGRISKGIGGGVCQLGNLIFWMVLHSPLTVTERWRHGFDLFPDDNRVLPFGSGATLSYNYIDLQFKNESRQTFQLKVWLDKQYLQGSLYAEKPLEQVYKIVEQDHCIRATYWGGYSRHNRIVRQVFDIAEPEILICEELITENHAIMCYQPFLSTVDSSE